ncbi:MAG: PEP-CTERM sorting domain-containing protein [Phycisphaerales bacterium JB063]
MTDSNFDIPVNHGSNEAGTPNVTLTWTDDRATPGDSAWDQYGGWPGDGGDGVYQLDNESDYSITHSIVFDPDNGFNVVINSFDLNVWAGGGATDVTWSVVGTSSGSLGGGVFNLADDSVTTQNLNIAGVSSETLTISFQQTSGESSYLALDNLTFDQTAVPEPGTAVMALGGLGALAMRRKRK